MARGRTQSRKGNFMSQFSRARESWIRVAGYEWILYEYAPFEEEEENESGRPYNFPDPVHTMAIAFPGARKPIRISLAAMREDELDQFQKFLNRAIELARPTVRKLDAAANKAWEEGDDTHARLYRPVPELFVRTRQQREHSARLQSRSARSAGDGGGDAEPGAGAGGGAVADDGPDPVGAPYDASEVRVGESVREVGGGGGDPVRLPPT